VTAEPMTATGGRQPVRTRSQAERRRKIVKTAAALASRGGVEAMQMRTVAERAGVALGTLYRYFPSKMDLVVAVVDEELDLLQNSISRRPPHGATPAERAMEVLTRATRGLMREPELTEALIRALMLTEIPVGFGDRMTRMLLHAATGEEEISVQDPRWALGRALASAWVMEMIELLRGRSNPEEIHNRLETAAARLIDF